MDLIAQLGGTYSSAFDAEATHLLYASDRLNDHSRDFRAAKSTKRFVCHPEWLQACLSLRKRADERAYPHTYKPGRALDYAVADASMGQDGDDDDDDEFELPPPLDYSPKTVSSVSKTTNDRNFGPDTAEFDNSRGKSPTTTTQNGAVAAAEEEEEEAEGALVDGDWSTTMTGRVAEVVAAEEAAASPSSSPPISAADRAQLSTEMGDRLLQKLMRPRAADKPRLAKVSCCCCCCLFCFRPPSFLVLYS
jgi:hypothetical protein